MRIIFILFLSLTNLANTALSAQGIDFQSDTTRWQAILDKAKAENKLVFVDAYTSWCGPCKRMAKDVFPQKAVGDVFNAAFINVKMDMENGEGPALAMRYGVKAYPTYMFINSSGELVHRGLGAMPMAKFIAVGQAAANPETQFFALKKKYDGGEKSAEFLKKLTFAASDAQEDALADEAASAYLKTQKDLSNDENIAFVYRFAKRLDSDALQYWIKNPTIFEKKFGKLQAEADLDERLVTAVGRPFFNGQKKEVNLEKAREAALKSVPVDVLDRVISLLKLQNCEMKGDVAGILSQAGSHLEKFPSANPNQLNDFAWFYSENTTDKMLLEKALGWSLKSVELSEASYPFHDTAAALYFKLGNKAKAKEFAEKAVKLGKDKKEDTAETESLLKKIDAMPEGAKR
jgi:thiol-disulfide isomerase/thioredoxin